MQSKKTIILSAGGTGGHLFTALALAEQLGRDFNVHLITDKRCQKYLVGNEPAKVHIFDLHLKMNSIINKIYSLLHLINICIKTLFLIFKLKPKLLIGFGGYSSFPSLLAARILNIPYILHEQNCFLGKTNRTFAASAKIIALSYQETVNIEKHIAEKVIFTGDIVRKSIKNLPIKSSFYNQDFHLFIFGGSQGAKIFSSLIPESIAEIIKLNPEVKLHITQQVAEEDYDSIAQLYNTLGIKHTLAPFFHNMAEIYANTDLIICRSGAGTIGELVYASVPAIFIPFPHAMEDHQYYNAKALADAGAGWCFRQDELTSIILAQKILTLIENRQLLEQTSKNLTKRRSGGADYLADTIRKIIS